MRLSARNQLNGTITNWSSARVMVAVTGDAAGQDIVAAITRYSAERLGLAEGRPVTVFIKASSVILGVDEA